MNYGTKLIFESNGEIVHLTTPDKILEDDVKHKSISNVKSLIFYIDVKLRILLSNMLGFHKDIKIKIIDDGIEIDENCILLNLANNRKNILIINIWENKND